MTDQEPTSDQGAERPDPPTEEAPTRELPPGERPEAGGARGPRRLLRSRDDRVIAGVAGGFGRYFDVDPVIFRIAFAVSILFGGLGVVAYLAVALFVPADEGDGTPGPRLEGAARVVGVTLLALIAIFGLGVLASIAAFVTGLGYGLGVAGLIVVIGLVLVALSFRGGARWWLIAPAVALALGGGVAAAADLDLDDGIGNREYRPASAASLPVDGYELGVGRLAVDLRDVDWTPTRVLDLELDIGFGEAVVAVPSNVCVVADAHAGAGDLMIAGQRADGLDVDVESGAGAQGTPQLRLRADVSAGAISVVNDDAVQIAADDRFDHEYPIDSELARSRNEEACSG